MLKLPSELTIAQVEDYRLEVQKIINENDAIVIDDTSVERIDTIGVQFILTIVTYILAQGKQLEYQSKSKIFHESLNQLGINDTFIMQYIPQA